jgi:iron complex transport system ATP-binding protein
MITINQLSKHYKKKTVLSKVSTQFPAGQLSSLIGPNGAGKTTLLMSIARLLEADEGQIQLDGRNIADIRIADYARRVATLRQSPDFNLRLTVEELVAFGRFPYTVSIAGTLAPVLSGRAERRSATDGFSGHDHCPANRLFAAG